MWVFRFSYFSGLYEVGFFNPSDNLLIKLYEFEQMQEAAQQVHFLNGGN